MKKSQLIGLVCGLALFVIIALFEFPGIGFAARIALAIFLLAAVFWITEPIPIYATSMLVIFLQMLLLSAEGLFFGSPNIVKDTAYAAPNYATFYTTLASPIIILFLGGFALASATVKNGLDRQLMFILLKPFGSCPRRVCLGLILVTALLSAFMSNTATTAMMITVVLPIVRQVDRDDPFRKAVALAIPVGANIGGIATPIGTPPNAVVLAGLREQGIIITFSEWMALAIPLVLLVLFIAWRVLLFLFPPRLERFTLGAQSEKAISRKGVFTYSIFALTAVLWITEKWHGIPATMIAFMPIAFLLTLGILDKKDINGFSWEVLWLVAGGISLGISIQNTGLAHWFIGLIRWEHFGGLGLIFIFGLVGYGIANLVSHTVSATLLLPIAISVGQSILPDSELAAVVIVIGVIVSFSMILPISTPPNAIAMSTDLIDARDLAKTGLLIGVIGFGLTLLCGFYFWPLFF